MKRLIFLFAIAAIYSFQATASSTYKVISNLYKTGSDLDSTLNEGEAVFEFRFRGLNPTDSAAMIDYSIDGFVGETQLQNGVLRFVTTGGPHIFQFYVNSDYEEVISDTLYIASGYVDYYNVTPFRRMRPEIITFKPVIYLYPEATLKATIQLDISGRDPFYYPAYDQEWQVTAQPDGSLTQNGETFRYLFWEATQEDHLSTISCDKGFIVKGSDAVKFLDAQLDAVGFTSIEKADFITFWGPQIAAMDQSYVRFEWNETCDKFAKLNVTPAPDHLFRYYIFIAPAPEGSVVEEQQLPKIDRSGFTVIEWGGQLSTINLNKAL